MNWHCTVSAGLGARCKGVQLWTVNYGNVARKIDRDLGAAGARREQQDTSSFPEVPACGSTYFNAPVRAIGSAVIGYATEIAVGVQYTRPGCFGQGKLSYEKENHIPFER